MYEVLKIFKDKYNLGHIYHEGEVYPVEGYTPHDGRVQFLIDNGYIKEKKKRKKKEDK